MQWSSAFEPNAHSIIANIYILNATLSQSTEERQKKKNTANKQTNARSFPLPRYINAKIIIFIRGWKYYSNSMWNFCLYTYLVNQPIRSVKHIHSHWQKIQSQQQHLKQHHASFYVNQLVAPAKMSIHEKFSRILACVLCFAFCVFYLHSVVHSRSKWWCSRRANTISARCVFLAPLCSLIVFVFLLVALFGDVHLNYFELLRLFITGLASLSPSIIHLVLYVIEPAWK